MSGNERSFPVHDLLVALLRDQNIHEGHWGLTVQFEARGAVLPEPSRPGANLPGLTIAVAGVTLILAADGEPGSVNAAVVNPVRGTASGRKTKVDRTLQ